MSDDVWGELLAAGREPVEAGGPDPSAGASAEMCARRSDWLAARARGDAETQAKAVRSLRALSDQGALERWGANSDILVVLGDLINAMVAGDVAAVSSTPGGGCP